MLNRFLENVTPQSKRDAYIINIDLMDENGTHVPESERVVHFQVENAIILGIGNGDPNGTQSDCASSIPMFKGRCQLIVKPTDVGVVRVTASLYGAQVLPGRVNGPSEVLTACQIRQVWSTMKS